ncbi:hypothetical protein pb186bvf_000022 [Paramecium bursaria]
MDNDISNSSIRSSSANVSKIFDNYMQQIMPTSVENKENIFIQERSNHRLKSTLQTPDRNSNRSSSQIQFIQALQKRNQELRTQNQQYEKQMSEFQSIQVVHDQFIELQSQSQQLENQNKELIRKLTQFQEQMILYEEQKELQIQQIVSQYKQQIDDLKQQVGLQQQRYKNFEETNTDSDKILTETLDELKKERQLTQKIKYDYRQLLEQNEMEADKQLQCQQKLYQELRQQFLQQQTDYLQQNTLLQDEITKYKTDNIRLNKQYSDLKQFYESQMKLVEQDVTKALADQRCQIKNLQKYCDEQEANNQELNIIIQNLEQQIQQQEIQINSQQDQLQIMNSQLYSTQEQNSQLINQLNDQLKELSSQIDYEKKMTEQSECYSNRQEEQQIDSIPQSEIKSNQQDYKTLINQIIEVEKEAYQLNTRYQQLFQEFQKDKNRYDRIDGSYKKKQLITL